MTSPFPQERPADQPVDPPGQVTCKRPGCGRPLPAAGRGRGRTRQFCSTECARRYHNDARVPAPRSPAPAAPDDPLTELEALVRQAAALVRAVRKQAAGTAPPRARALLAEAEAARLRAEASAAEAAGRATEARRQIEALTEALDAAREEVRAVRAELRRRDRPPGERG